MANRNSRDWMWSDALQMLARADQLHRQVFRPAAATRAPCWEPPIDLLETTGKVQIIAALPGVDPEGVQVFIDEGGDGARPVAKLEDFDGHVVGSQHPLGDQHHPALTGLIESQARMSGQHRPAGFADLDASRRGNGHRLGSGTKAPGGTCPAT